MISSNVAVLKTVYHKFSNYLMDQHKNKAEKFQDFQLITGKTEITYNNKSSRTILFSLLVSLRYPPTSSQLTQTALLPWIHS